MTEKFASPICATRPLMLGMDQGGAETAAHFEIESAIKATVVIPTKNPGSIFKRVIE